jgi:transposase
MKPYSKDLRLRVLAAVDRGMPREEVAETFGVCKPTIGRYLRLRRETGVVDPKAPSGPLARKGRALEAALPSQVWRNPDLTLEEHRELFYDEHGTEVCRATISRALKKRLGLALKKSPSRPKRARRSREGTLARRGKAPRSRAPGVRGRVRYAHLDEPPQGQGAQGPEGLR